MPLHQDSPNLHMCKKIMFVCDAGITEVRNLSVGGAWGYFSTDLVDQTVRSWLLFSSAGCFQKVIRRQGHDITNLLACTWLTLTTHCLFKLHVSLHHMSSFSQMVLKLGVEDAPFTGGRGRDESMPLHRKAWGHRMASVCCLRACASSRGE